MIEDLFEDELGTPPVPIGPQVEVRKDQLVPGAVIRRYTEPGRGEYRVIVLVPCCGRKARLTFSYEQYWHLILCAFCAVPYKATLTPDSDDGYWADLTVESIPFATTSRR